MSNLKYYVYIPSQEHYFTIDYSLDMNDPKSLYQVTNELVAEGIDYYCFLNSTPAGEYSFSANRKTLLPKYFPEVFINYLLLLGELNKEDLDYINKRVRNIEG